MNEEERKVLKECERESFYQRALPYATGAIVGVQVLSRMGKLSLHPKYGTLPKSVFAAGAGYFLGKLSYLPICREKILRQIPDSPLASQIRQRDHSRTEPVQSVDDGEQRQDSFSPPPSSEGLDDRFRPSVDRDVRVKEEIEEKKTTTYEDLRRRNREEHAKQPQKPPGNKSAYKESPLMPQKIWPDGNSERSQKDENSSPPPEVRPKRKRTNMWGDVIED